jgi:signal transduction histidine kinase
MVPQLFVNWLTPRDLTTREEQLRAERLLTTARLFLAAISLVAVYLDPSEPSLFPAAAYGLITAYLAFSVVLAVLAALSPSALLAARLGIHVVVIAWAAAITLLTEGPSSPFFVFFVFVILAAATRWGILDTLLTGAVVVFAFMLEALVTSMLLGTAGKHNGVSVLMRSGYLLILTPVVAALAAQERNLRAQRGSLARATAGIKSAGTLREALHAVADECLAFFSARAVLLVVEDARDGRGFAWRATRREGAAGVELTYRELGPSPAGAGLVTLPPGVLACGVRRTRGGRVAGRAIELDLEGFERVMAFDPAALVPVLEQEEARRLACVPVSVEDAWQGQVLLLDPQGPTDGDLGFLRAFTAQIAPALYNAFLVRRVRWRVRSVERARVGRELHDGVIQSLIGVEMEVEALRRLEDDATRVGRLAAVRDDLRRSIADVRDLMTRLRSSPVMPASLIEELALLVERFGRDTGIDARFAPLVVAPLDCSPRVCRELVAIVGEALANVRRHSGASRVDVRVRADGERCRVVVEDDGRGFGFEGTLGHEALMASSAGPRLIKERVAETGARLSVTSRPGGGASVEVEWANAGPSGRVTASAS